MAETLDQVKDRVSRKYLGKEGIHGVGLRRSSGAITIYFSPSQAESQQDLLDTITQEVRPFKVLVVQSKRPKFL
jgi:hypothetical protein